MTGIEAFNPTTEILLSQEGLKRLATHYKIQLKPELLVAKSVIKRRMEKNKLGHVSNPEGCLLRGSDDSSQQLQCLVPSSHCAKDHHGPKQAHQPCHHVS